MKANTIMKANTYNKNNIYLPSTGARISKNDPIRNAYTQYEDKAIIQLAPDWLKIQKEYCNERTTEAIRQRYYLLKKKKKVDSFTKPKFPQKRKPWTDQEIYTLLRFARLRTWKEVGLMMNPTRTPQAVKLKYLRLHRIITRNSTRGFEPTEQ